MHVREEPREKRGRNRGRKRKVQAGIPGKEGNTGKLSLVEILADHFITGACYAPVNIRQGESR